MKVWRQLYNSALFCFKLQPHLHQTHFTLVHTEGKNVEKYPAFLKEEPWKRGGVVTCDVFIKTRTAVRPPWIPGAWFCLIGLFVFNFLPPSDMMTAALINHCKVNIRYDQSHAEQIQMDPGALYKHQRRLNTERLVAAPLASSFIHTLWQRFCAAALYVRRFLNRMKAAYESWTLWSSVTPSYVHILPFFQGPALFVHPINSEIL